MSEYQYYEFRAVDRPLTQRQMEELRAYSSRARISPDSFVNVYNWGDFKGDPARWMEEYFDAFVYLANWGTRTLMLRVPTRLLDPDTVQKYCARDSFSSWTKGAHLILTFHSEEEECEWDDGEGWLGSLVQLRSDLIRGDYRCLYLGWLLAVQTGELDDDTVEPPLPSGLGALNAPLGSIADFLGISPDLIAAAAEKSEKEPAGRLSAEDIAGWVAKLTLKEKDAVLTKLLEGDDSHIAAELRHRALSDIRGERKCGSGSQAGDRRKVGRLLDREDVIEKQRKKREADQQERERVRREKAEAEERRKHLESLDGREGALWIQIDKLIATKQPKRYDEAVLLLQDLRDLADIKGAGSEFGLRMSALYREHIKKPSLLERFRKAKLSG